MGRGGQNHLKHNCGDPLPTLNRPCICTRSRVVLSPAVMELSPGPAGDGGGEERSSCGEDRQKNVFVTVGTTSFDALVRAATSAEFLEVGSLIS